MKKPPCILARNTDSYARYPFMIYQIQTKFRDDLAEGRAHTGTGIYHERRVFLSYLSGGSGGVLPEMPQGLRTDFCQGRPPSSGFRSLGFRHDGWEPFPRIYASFPCGGGFCGALPRLWIPGQYGSWRPISPLLLEKTPLLRSKCFLHRIQKLPLSQTNCAGHSYIGWKKRRNMPSASCAVVLR